LSADGFVVSLEGQTALVTGGSGGIGKAICLVLAKAGAFVAINYRSSETAAQELLGAIISQGGRGAVEKFDVSNSSDVERGIGRVLESTGTIDILVNNAGIASDGLAARMKDPEWDAVLSANLTGAFHVSRTVMKTMIRSRKGRIINISSTAGEAGNAGQANYSAAKAGLIGLTKSLARELAPRGILVNCVSPGIISGGMMDRLDESQVEAIRNHVPLGRLGNAEDVANAVLFLCSHMSAYITGQVVRVNGGLYM
jgi:3-oxoacyl-[acyl-carrier protein] reductase